MFDNGMSIGEPNYREEQVYPCGNGLENTGEKSAQKASPLWWCQILKGM